MHAALNIPDSRAVLTRAITSRGLPFGAHTPSREHQSATRERNGFASSALKVSGGNREQPRDFVFFSSFFFFLSSRMKFLTFRWLVCVLRRFANAEQPKKRLRPGAKGRKGVPRCTMPREMICT